MKHPDRSAVARTLPNPLPVRSLRILVVETHPDMRRGLEVFLESLGHLPRLAGDVHGALEIAASDERFDLLLSDIHLPDGSGRELPGLLERAGRKPSHAIAMSGFGSVDDSERSRAAGFRAHLVKPGSPGELEAALNEVAALR